jgi:hypothetical protein
LRSLRSGPLGLQRGHVDVHYARAVSGRTYDGGMHVAPWCLAAVLVAAATGVAGCTDDPPAGGSGRTVARADDFEQPDGPLVDDPDLDTGQTWTLDFAAPATEGALVVSRDELYLRSAGASYLWTTGGPVKGGSVRFRFVPGSTARSGVNMSFSKVRGNEATGTGGVFTNSIHTTIHSDSIRVAAFVDGGFTPIRVIPVDLSSPSEHTVTILRTAPDTVTVRAPGIEPVQVHDRRIGLLWGNTVGVEHFRPTGTYKTDDEPVITGYTVYSPG